MQLRTHQCESFFLLQEKSGDFPQAAPKGTMCWLVQRAADRHLGRVVAPPPPAASAHKCCCCSWASPSLAAATSKRHFSLLLLLLLLPMSSFRPPTCWQSSFPPHLWSAHSHPPATRCVCPCPSPLAGCMQKNCFLVLSGCCLPVTYAVWRDSALTYLILILSKMHFLTPCAGGVRSAGNDLPGHQPLRPRRCHNGADL